MPRDGSQVYSVPVGTDGVPNTTILSAKYNTFIHDVETDLNTPRPVVAGGTAATSVNGALVNLSAEKAAQVITNWDSMLWMPGSFYAATTATGTAPVAAHAFAGIVYLNEPEANPPTNQNLIVEALDLTDSAHAGYFRIMTAGVWSSWIKKIDPGSIHWDIVQTLTAPQQTQARQNMYAAPFDAMAYSGMQVNGGCEVSQERGTASFTQIASGVPVYILDGWKIQSVGVSRSTISQGTTSPYIPPGFRNSAIIAISTANASPAASDYCSFVLAIEGTRTARLGWGTANASPITLSFWVCAVRPGTYSGSITNGAYNRTYTFTFSVVSVLTWEYKTITIPGDTTGTWPTDNSTAITVSISMMVGSSNVTAAGVWTSGGFLGAPGSVNGAASTADYMIIAGLVVLPTIEAPSAARSPFIMRPFDQELLLCQRYYQKYLGLLLAGNPPASSTIYISYIYPMMRAAPTVAFANTSYSNASGLGINTATPNFTAFNFVANASGLAYVRSDISFDARI